MAHQLSERFGEIEDKLKSAAHQTAERLKPADALVRDHPWATAGLAACVGVLIGWLIARD